MNHPLGEDYELWCEANPCPTCAGDGEVEDDEGRCETCRECDGCGIDHSAVYESTDGGSAVLPGNPPEQSLTERTI